MRARQVIHVETDQERKARARAAGQGVRAVNAERRAHLAEREAGKVAREAELAACKAALAELAEVKARKVHTQSGVTVATAVERAHECEHGGGLLLTPILDGKIRRLYLCTSCAWAIGQVGRPIRTESGITLVRTGNQRSLWFEPCGCITENGATVRPCDSCWCNAQTEAPHPHDRATCG